MEQLVPYDGLYDMMLAIQVVEMFCHNNKHGTISPPKGIF